ncbi:MAG TPA: MoaD/ThiS family protein [Aquabacterium sp.]|uniref:sulfur carrier protein ThiS n=1 Tax=Aquabacterium sp. TaxID=1872578 RepID=UPI002E32EE7B|nr:MoaD/ThiS family protein [Aquabacterium sp.]HEX5356324.1 MoaD/ThiS family protein [Aquabacterium sp.]
MNIAASPALHITVHTDQGPLSLPPGSTLSDALAHLLPLMNKQAEQVATAVNGEFVARGARAAHLLQDGDAVLCFSPITGG